MKLFANERIRVWDMCVLPGSDTSWHHHAHDYIFLQIGEGVCTVQQVVDGEVSARSDPSPVGAKSCTFKTASQEGPVIHNLYNADPENNYRQILIEFLEPQPRHTAAEVEACLSNAA